MTLRRSHWLPALLLLGAALAATLLPGAFLLTRDGLARGELWRLWTGHLVHHTTAHFLFDVGAALLLLGFVRSRLTWILLPPIVGAAFLCTRPELTSYAGLSGVLHGLFALACFEISRRARGVERVLALTAVLGVVAKAAVESITHTPLLTSQFDMGGATVFEAHLAGVASALLVTLWRVRKRPTHPGVIGALTRRAGGTAVGVTSPPLLSSSVGGGRAALDDLCWVALRVGCRWVCGPCRGAAAVHRGCATIWPPLP